MENDHWRTLMKCQQSRGIFFFFNILANFTDGIFQNFKSLGN